MVQVPDDLAPALADLAIVGAAVQARRDGGGRLHPALAELLARLAIACDRPSASLGHPEHGESRAWPASAVGLVSTAEAARRLGVTAGRIRQLAAAGRLPAHRLGRDWLIELHPEDLGGDGDGGEHRTGGT